MKDYTIQFSGLAEGLHEFSFVLEKPFFDIFETEAIRDGRVNVAVTLDKQTRMMLFTFDISGEVEVICDRCADPLKIRVEGTDDLIVRVCNSEETDTDEIVFISEEAFEIDLTQHLYDYVNLLLPMRLTHAESSDGTSCDPEMIRLLEQYSKEKQTDNRWEGLSGLRNEDEEITQ